MMRGFDSIESMNAEELLVKRERGSKRFLVATAIIGGLFFLIGILVGYFSHNSTAIPPKPTPKPTPIDVDSYILNNVNKEFIKKTISDYSTRARVPGTKDNYELAKYIQSMWQSAGLESVRLETYNALLSLAGDSAPNKVELFNTTSSFVVAATLPAEPPLRTDDKDTSTPSYSAFSPPGNLTGLLVYAYYGRMEDLNYLTTSLGIDLSGKIILVREGKIYRWTKVRNAEAVNASAVLLYPDPADINVAMGEEDEAYPGSWWLPDSGLQQGPTSRGGSLTDGLGYPARADSFIPSVQHADLPKITSQPISYGFALQILSNMSGPGAPNGWQGGLPIDYHVGPGWQDGDLQIRVIVNNVVRMGDVHNVIGQITGLEEPDRYVILGSHHDSWATGAADPHSGGASLSQVATIFGNLLRMGYRPRRTVLFCSWDGEEVGSLGSREWVKDHLRAVQQGAVAYLNLDAVAQGNFTLGAESSPLLQDSLYAAAKKVPSPDPAFRSLYDLWLHRPSADTGHQDVKEPFVSYTYSAVGDHVPFYSDVGVATVNIMSTFNKTQFNMATFPAYHSAYDTPYLYQTFQDPGLNFTTALTKFVSLWTHDMSNSSLLSFNVTRLSTFVETILGDIITKYNEEWKAEDIDIDNLTSAAHNLSVEASQFDASILQEDSPNMAFNRQRLYNDKMMQIGKLFSDPRGFPGTPIQKNLLLGCDPDTVDIPIYFPGVTNTMTQILAGQDNLWPDLKQQLSLVTFLLQAAARSLGWTGL